MSVHGSKNGSVDGEDDSSAVETVESDREVTSLESEVLNEDTDGDAGGDLVREDSKSKNENAAGGDRKENGPDGEDCLAM